MSDTSLPPSDSATQRSGLPRRLIDRLTLANIGIAIVLVTAGGLATFFLALGFSLGTPSVAAAKMNERIAIVEVSQATADSLFAAHVAAEMEDRRALNDFMQVVATTGCLSIPPANRQGIRLPCARLLAGESVDFMPRRTR